MKRYIQVETKPISSALEQSYKFQNTMLWCIGLLLLCFIISFVIIVHASPYQLNITNGTLTLYDLNLTNDTTNITIYVNIIYQNYTTILNVTNVNVTCVNCSNYYNNTYIDNTTTNINYSNFYSKDEHAKYLLKSELGSYAGKGEFDELVVRVNNITDIKVDVQETSHTFMWVIILIIMFAFGYMYYLAMSG